MTIEESTFDRAWVCLGTHDSSSFSTHWVWRKQSTLEFQMMCIDNENTCLRDDPHNMFIGSFGRLAVDTKTSLLLDKVLDPNTCEVAVKDVYDLKCKTPFELLVALDLRGLVVYQ